MTRTYHDLAVYEDEVMRLGEEIANLKTWVDIFSGPAPLTVADEIALAKILRKLKEKRARMRVLVNRAQTGLF